MPVAATKLTPSRPPGELAPPSPCSANAVIGGVSDSTARGLPPHHSVSRTLIRRSASYWFMAVFVLYLASRVRRSGGLIESRFPIQGKTLMSL